MSEGRGGWVYIMADRYRGTMYTGVTAVIAPRVHQHRTGEGSDFCARYGLVRLVWAEWGDDIVACIEHEKRIKRWRREWKFALIERGNPRLGRSVRHAGLMESVARQRGPGSRPG